MVRQMNGLEKDIFLISQAATFQSTPGKIAKSLVRSVSCLSLFPTLLSFALPPGSASQARREYCFFV